MDTLFSNYVAEAAYLANIFARPDCERHNLQLGVVWLNVSKSLIYHILGRKDNVAAIIDFQLFNIKQYLWVQD